MRKKLKQELSQIALGASTDFQVAGKPVVEGALYKTSSKLKAIEMIAKMLGIYEPKQKSEESVVIIDDFKFE